MGSLFGLEVLNFPNKLNPGTTDNGGPGYLFKHVVLVSIHNVCGISTNDTLPLEPKYLIGGYSGTGVCIICHISHNLGINCLIKISNNENSHFSITDIKFLKSVVIVI